MKRKTPMSGNISPWLHNLKRERPEHELTGAKYADICVLGGGIAGVSTAYELLKKTDKKIILIEGGKIAHGATGHNGGYAIADFEKKFEDIVRENGLYEARQGLKELDDAVIEWDKISNMLNLRHVDRQPSIEAFSDVEHFVALLHEMHLKYGELKFPFYLIEGSNWIDSVPENFKSHVKILNEEEFKKVLRTQDIDTKIYQGVFIEEMGIGNSAEFSESLAKYCLEKYGDRFQIFENSFVSSIRLEQNGGIILDSLRGVAVVQNLVLCTNGFENFNIYGPYNRSINTIFHHTVSGLIGYMIGSFRKGKVRDEVGGVFFGKEFKYGNDPIKSGPYYYYTNRHFTVDGEDGELVCLGGPELDLEERKVYRKDHEMDKAVSDNLRDFQKKILGVQEEPIFKWHGLMGYTQSGVRVVGRDVRFSNLYYNLGCNGIGLIPSIAGAKRIARLLSGEKLPRSVFDPR